MMKSAPSSAASHPTTDQSTLAASHDDFRRPIFGLRGRALLVGIPLIILISFLSVFADMVSKRVQFGVLQLAPPAIAGLFILALLNMGLKKLMKREFLNHADVLVVYAMMLVGVMVSTRGVIEKIIPPLVYLPYFATQENRLNEQITQHLPSWAIPFSPNVQTGQAPSWITAYFEGVRPGQAIPWSVWIAPLTAWLALIACVILVFASLATLLRRQWMDNEQLRFPLTTLPLAMIKNEVEGQPFFTNRLMWMGFGLSAIVFGVNGLNANFPDWPRFVVNLDLNSLLTERPWNAVDYTPVYISLAAIGFAYFLPTDLLFSLWFFFLLTRLQDVFAVQLGGIPTAIGTHNARVWTGYQAAGAYVVLVFAQIRIGWPYFKQVWKTAWSAQKPLDDRDELMSYRSAFIGLTLGFVGIVVWLSIAGMSPWLAVAQMGIYLFFVAIIMSRAVCEAGLLMTETSFLPMHLIRMVHPLEGLGAQNLSLLAMMNAVFARDLRGVLLSPLMDNQKMAGELRLKQRALLLPLGLASLIAFFVAAYFFLYFSYTKGNLTLYQYPTQNAQNMYNFSKGYIQGGSPPIDSTAYGGFGVGVAVTMLLVWMRATFLWFPLHPLAYAIVANWSGIVFWFPFLVAWIIKSGVLRFGGADTFRKVAPFMLGMILGEFTLAMFWAVMSMPFINWSAPEFPWP